jgi:hypothetical protein
MHREGNASIYRRLGDHSRHHLYGKGTVALIAVLCLSIALSENLDSENIVLPIGRSREYIDFEQCFEENLAQGGLSVVCTGKDSVSWRVEQTQSDFIVPKLDIGTTPQEAAALTQIRNESIDSVQLRNPLILTPADQDGCSQACTVVARDNEGNFSYYNLTSKSGIYAVNQSLYQVPLKLESAVLEDKR